MLQGKTLIEENYALLQKFGFHFSLLAVRGVQQDFIKLSRVAPIVLTQPKCGRRGSTTTLVKVAASDSEKNVSQNAEKYLLDVLQAAVLPESGVDRRTALIAMHVALTPRLKMDQNIMLSKRHSVVNLEIVQLQNKWIHFVTLQCFRNRM